MRLFILAIVAGIGVLVGVALYVGQEIVNPGTPDAKLTEKLAEQHEAIAASEIDTHKSESRVSSERKELHKVASSETETDGKDAHIDAYKSQLSEAQFPAGTTSFDTAALRKQLPDIFQFPEQPGPPPIAVATVLTPPKAETFPAPVAERPAMESNSASAIVPDTPTTTNGSDLSPSNNDVRPDAPMLKHLTAPEHKPSVSTANNPNVQVEVAPASEGRSARTRMIVNR